MFQSPLCNIHTTVRLQCFCSTVFTFTEQSRAVWNPAIIELGLLPVFSLRRFFCVASDDTPPQRGWRRPPGSTNVLPAFDALNLALDRTSRRAVSTASGLCDVFLFNSVILYMYAICTVRYWLSSGGGRRKQYRGGEGKLCGPCSAWDPEPVPQ